MIKKQGHLNQANHFLDKVSICRKQKKISMLIAMCCKSCVKAIKAAIYRASVGIEL